MRGSGGLTRYIVKVPVSQWLMPAAKCPGSSTVTKFRRNLYSSSPPCTMSKAMTTARSTFLLVGFIAACDF